MSSGAASDRWSHLFEEAERHPPPPRRLLGDILVGRGAITAAELQAALEVQRREGGRLGEILVTESRLTLAQLIDAVSEQCGIPREPAGALRSRLAERRGNAA